MSKVDNYAEIIGHKEPFIFDGIETIHNESILLKNNIFYFPNKNKEIFINFSGAQARKLNFTQLKKYYED